MPMRLTRVSFTILVVDDEPTVFDLLVHTARSLFPEAHFSHARSPKETMAYLSDPLLPLPDVVLLDIDLHAASNGLDLLAQLYSRFRGRVPVVMLTASSDQRLLYQAYDRGAVAYTQKPDDLTGWKDYVAALRELLLTIYRLRSPDFSVKEL